MKCCFKCGAPILFRAWITDPITRIRSSDIWLAGPLLIPDYMREIWVANQSPTMASPAAHTLVFEVLRVVSPDVLGETKPLTLADSFRFSNALGELKDVAGFGEIKEVAARSAIRFKAALQQR